MKQKDERVEFAPPENASLPEGAMDGDEFDLVCTFKRKGSKICMTKFGDTPMPGYEKGYGDQQPKRPDYSEYAQGIYSQMAGGGGGGEGGGA